MLTQVALVYQMTLDQHGPTPAGVCCSDGAGQVLLVMARNSRIGRAFNLLRSNRGDDLLWGDEPDEWERFCRDRTGGRCEVEIHPDGGEWTLRVRL